MLKKSEPRARRRRLGAVAVCVLVTATSYGAWAFRPADIAATGAAPITTGSSQAPAAPVDREAGVQRESRILAPPRYPAEAMETRTSGKVIMRVLVGADGVVKDVVVEESVPAGVFDASSVEAAWLWRFDPAVKDGKPVDGWVRVPVEYEWEPLEDEERPQGGG